MRSLLGMVGLAFGGFLAMTATPARATFHQWRIQEVFTNANGSTQFIELFCPAAFTGEFFLNGHSITATSDGGPPVAFTLNHNLSGQPSTGGQTFLIATAGFAELVGGVAPDYPTLPSGFFNPSAGSITLNFAGVDSLTFAGSLLPKNGVNSLVDLDPSGIAQLVSLANSPKNFAGAAGSVNLAPTPLAGDFDESGAVDAADLILWRGGFGMQGASVDHNDGDANADDNVDGNDFLTWQNQLGGSQASPAAAAVPEPPTAALIAACAALAVVVRRDRLARWTSSD